MLNDSLALIEHPGHRPRGIHKDKVEQWRGMGRRFPRLL